MFDLLEEGHLRVGEDLLGGEVLRLGGVVRLDERGAEGRVPVLGVLHRRSEALLYLGQMLVRQRDVLLRRGELHLLHLRRVGGVHLAGADARQLCDLLLHGAVDLRMLLLPFALQRRLLVLHRRAVAELLLHRVLQLLALVQGGPDGRRFRRGGHARVGAHHLHRHLHPFLLGHRLHLLPHLLLVSAAGRRAGEGLGGVLLLDGLQQLFQRKEELFSRTDELAFLRHQRFGGCFLYGRRGSGNGGEDGGQVALDGGLGGEQCGADE